MDSLSQIALGATVTVAAMGSRVSLRRAALWGAIAGTLPDLDTFIDFGDAILNMVRHRAESHSLIFLTLAAPLLAWLISRIHREPQLFYRWWLSMTLALTTHPLLDWFTIYGTQLFQPITDHPFGLGSVFIIDPLVTLPLLIGLGMAALIRHPTWRQRANALGLALACTYLAWSAIAQQYVTRVSERALPADAVDGRGLLLVTPAPFNTLLWRIVVVTEDRYYEGWFSLFDPPREALRWQGFDRGTQLIATHATTHPGAARIAAFSKGFYSMDEQDGRIFVTDLRMGQEPFYSFRFDLGPAATAMQTAQISRRRPPVATALPWLWARMLGDTSADSLKITVEAPGVRAR